MAQLKTTKVSGDITVTGEIIDSDNLSLQDKYAPLSHKHTVLDLSNEFDNLPINGSLLVKASESSTNKPKGLQLIDTSGNIKGGVGSVSNNGSYDALYLAMAEDYYNINKGLAITPDSITWKGVDVATVNSNVASANKLANPRTISLSGDVTGSVVFDGSSNINIPVVVASSINKYEAYTDDIATSLYMSLLRTPVNTEFYLAKVLVMSKSLTSDVTDMIIVEILGYSNTTPTITVRSNNNNDYFEAVRVIYPKNKNSGLSTYVEFKFPNNSSRTVSAHVLDSYNIEALGPFESSIYDETVYSYTEKSLLKGSCVYSVNASYDKAIDSITTDYIDFTSHGYTVAEALKENDLAIVNSSNSLYKITTAGISYSIGNPIIRIDSDHEVGNVSIYGKLNYKVPYSSYTSSTATTLYLQGKVSGNTFISEGSLVTTLVSDKYYIRIGVVQSGYLNLDLNHNCYYYDGSSLSNYIVSKVPTKTSQLINDSGFVTTASSGIKVLQRNTSYPIGEVVYTDAVPSWGYLECITAGVTASTPFNPTISYYIETVDDLHSTIKVNEEHIVESSYPAGSSITLSVDLDEGYDLELFSYEEMGDTGLQVGNTFTDGTVVWKLRAMNSLENDPSTTILYSNTENTMITDAVLSKSYLDFNGVVVILDYEDLDTGLTYIYNTIIWKWQILESKKVNPNAVLTFPVIGDIFVQFPTDTTVRTYSYNIRRVVGLK